MKKVVTKLGLFIIIINNLIAQNFYQNPIISGFNPDPSICKVGDEYYLVTSSFSYFPGVPIYKSKDLVNWEHIGYCLTRNSQLPLKSGGISGGIWAPTIRYNKGRFYMITTNQNIGKNFIVFSENPTQSWSEPIWLDIKGYDPSLYFENDKCILTYTSGEGENGIMQCEIDINTGKFITQPKVIWKGTGEFGTEGPHIYKIKNFYYLMVAEGGTGLMHSVSIVRSKNIDGPWELCPRNPILTNRNKRWMRTQATGHADIVEDNQGKWWMVHLGIRNYGSFEDQQSNLGRETNILPMDWDADGWPIVNTTGNSDLKIESKVVQKPDTLSFIENFDNKISKSWNFIRNSDSTFYSLKEGLLNLQGSKAGLDSSGKIAFLGFRQKHYGMTCKVKFDFTPISDNEEAGITIFMSNWYHYDFFITKRNGKRVAVVRRVIDDIKIEVSKTEIADGVQTFEIEGNPWAYMFYVIDSNGNKIKVAHAQSQFISLKVAGGFTGMYLGIYATGHGKLTQNKALFDKIIYKKTKDW